MHNDYSYVYGSMENWNEDDGLDRVVDDSDPWEKLDDNDISSLYDKE